METTGSQRDNDIRSPFVASGEGQRSGRGPQGPATLPFRSSSSGTGGRSSVQALWLQHSVHNLRKRAGFLYPRDRAQKV